ncbi:MAG TPA: DEAD/DEAH box helicase, partial [Myxococcota bacterium]|nr:DEAD/DEAH box helicase [Myxococcota bacterium]
MPSHLVLAPALDLAPARPYAERREEESGWHDHLAEFLFATAIAPARNRIRDSERRLRRIADLAEAQGRALRFATDADLLARARAMRPRLRRVGFQPWLAAECFALVREAAGRTLGKRHFESQIMAGWALLQGKLVEMATGEGKTIAATLPACTVALAGYPVHVITVNDYLAARDAEEMGPLYRFLGLSVGTVVQGMPRDERRKAYAQSVTYCTNKELAFDYLRDRVALESCGSRLHLSLEALRGEAARDASLVLRGLYYAIVDEADSVFVDEARTPLILSSTTRSPREKEMCERALGLARSLAEGADYAVDLVERSVVLSEAGRGRLQRLTQDDGGAWTSKRAREELVQRALSALALFRRDHHYVVSEGKVQIVDESTGRVMPDRSWEQGLHQMIEAKEGCELTERRETLARITYQRLFRRYLRLAGMSGTAKEVAREIKLVYRLDVVRIPLHKPSRRVVGATRLCATLAEKWGAVADAAQRLAVEQGRPVLIGTRSVKASEEIAAVLAARGVEHALLNAKQDKQEAQVVASAGQPGRVTVATNMAGRGTDIRLGGTGGDAGQVARAGGLLVIGVGRHASSRLDHQLRGRSGRQGDPGGSVFFVSMADELITSCVPGAPPFEATDDGQVTSARA